MKTPTQLKLEMLNKFLRRVHCPDLGNRSRCTYLLNNGAVLSSRGGRRRLLQQAEIRELAPPLGIDLGELPVALTAACGYGSVTAAIVPERLAFALHRLMRAEVCQPAVS